MRPGPVQPTKPLQPPATIVHPDTPSTANPVDDRLVSLEKKMQELIDRVGNIRATQGPEGKTGPGGAVGPQGPVGATGPAGPQGAAGKDADLTRIQKLEEEINKLRSQNLRVELIDSDGKVIQTDTFNADKPLRIRLKPVE